MPNPHSLVPVGMFGVQTNRANLQSDLQQIYEGSALSGQEACNAVHAYQEPSQSDNPNLAKEVVAVSQYKNLVQRSVQASGNRLACLVGDLTQKKIDPPAVPYFYDGQVPNLTRVTDFTNNFIDEINTLGLSCNVLGWYLADEPRNINGDSTHPSRQDVQDICNAVHTAQLAKGWNKPFYIVFYMDANWATDNNSIDFAQWVDPWVNTVTTCVDAQLVIMIDYYPWQSMAEDFKFRETGSAAGLSPLHRWWQFIHDTNARYATNTNVVGVQAVLQAWALRSAANFDPSRIPSHADMHQQIRAVRNFMGESGSKPGGVWLYAWGRGATGTPSAQSPWDAWNRWTQAGTEQYAEAVQNEIDNQTEAITAAIPPDNTVLEANPRYYYRLNLNTKNGGTWIFYRQKDRGVVSFSIKNPAGTEVRDLTWDYGASNNYASVQQKASNTVRDSPGQVDKLGAVAICFDGKDNNGNELPRYYPFQDYTVQMRLNGQLVGNVVPLTVQDSRLPFRLPQEMGQIAPDA